VLIQPSPWTAQHEGTDVVVSRFSTADFVTAGLHLVQMWVEGRIDNNILGDEVVQIHVSIYLWIRWLSLHFLVSN
jgi:hypothetical protein